MEVLFEYLPLITLAISVVALIFALLTAKKIIKFPEGTDKMKQIAGWIRQGANAYLKRQYKVVGVFFACMFVVLSVMAAFNLLSWFVPFAFVTGGLFSALSGFVAYTAFLASIMPLFTPRCTIISLCFQFL